MTFDEATKNVGEHVLIEHDSGNILREAVIIDYNEDYVRVRYVDSGWETWEEPHMMELKWATK